MPEPSHIEFLARALVRFHGHVLVCRHNPQGGYLVLPGGHIDHGETAAAAAGREFSEEVGIPATVGPCLAATEQIFEQRGRIRHELTLVFHVEHPPEWAGSTLPELVSPEEPRVSLEWVPEADLAHADLRPAAIKRWLVALVGGASPFAPGTISWLE